MVKSGASSFRSHTRFKAPDDVDRDNTFDTFSRAPRTRRADEGIDLVIRQPSPLVSSEQQRRVEGATGRFRDQEHRADEHESAEGRSYIIQPSERGRVQV